MTTELIATPVRMPWSHDHIQHFHVSIPSTPQFTRLSRTYRKAFRPFTVS